jgi:3-dehydroquinate dehydratase type II
MLGIREPDIYGKQTYEALLELIGNHAAARGVEVSFFQSNHEGAIVDAIQQAYFDKVDGIVINPAAYTHTSVAILDALKAVTIPTVEVHLSDIQNRDEFRKHSDISPVCVATICGKGFNGYLEAMDLLLK